MSDVDSLQILLFELKLHLLVTEFFTKTLFFFVQVQEDLNVSIELLFLFSLYDFGVQELLMLFLPIKQSRDMRS